MTGIFVDTVALLALWNESDQWHDAAEAAFLRAYQQNQPLFSTSYVLLECGNAIARKPYRNVLVDFREKLVKSNHLIEPLPEDLEKAWSAFARHESGNAGIVDLISFEVMRRLRAVDALTNDEHFRISGFKTLM